MTRHLTASEKHQTMTRLMATTQGRRRIAASVVGPLRKIRDYTAVGRRALQIDELPDGALPIYDIDPDVGAFFVNEEAMLIQSIQKTNRITVPMYTLTAYPTIQIQSIKERRFDVMKRITEKAKSQLFRAEDQATFGTLSAAAALNTNISVSAANFSMDTMADAYSFVEANDLRVDKVFINPRNAPVFRTAGRDFLDFETQRELLKTGYLGVLWGAEIHQSNMVPVNQVLIVTEPEYLGVSPTRIDLTILPCDDLKKLQLGFVLFEHLGTAVHNPLGVKGILITP